MRARARALVICAAAVVTVLAEPVAAEESAQAEAQIRATLTRWLSDFNAGKASNICDLFAIDLRADVRGQPERGYAALCDLLERSLRDPERAYSYALTIKERRVGRHGHRAAGLDAYHASEGRSGSGAVSRTGHGRAVSADAGSWKIVRFMAYTE